MDAGVKKKKSVMINAMSVDVEDYFQVSAFEKYVKKSMWSKYETRVEYNTNRILDIFKDAGVEATFFVLGWVAERYPELIKRIATEGHEVASHGYEHVRVTKQTHEEFREDIIKTKNILENLTGDEVKGYRAASYSICKDNLWALELLDETGHKYSSSIYPIKHDLYGIPDAPRFAYRPNGNAGILEIPITTLEIGKKRFPCGGGGFFRLYPYLISKMAYQYINTRNQQPGIFYFHPWEIDPQQPRPFSNLGFKTKFRHYFNLDKTETRLKFLLRDFSWGRMDRIFLPGNK